MSNSIAGLDLSLSALTWDRISPYVLPSVLWSLYSFLRTPNDFWETICTAVCPGGDVDTTGAMAGAISGAYNGVGSIPEGVKDRLQDAGLLLSPLLTSLGNALYRQRAKR